MREVRPPFLDRPVSALGFGCASLGSRVGETVGRAAIERALAGGVTWFDVAPSYGDGAAEEILGRALGPRARTVALVSKVGIAARPPAGTKRLAARLARPVLALAPGLRALARTLRGDATRREPLTGALVRDSLERSLRRLGTERLAVLALHEPTVEDVAREDVIDALHRAKRAGHIAAVGVAGDPAVVRAARRAGLAVDVCQHAAPAIGEPAEDAPGFRVVHSVFGVDGAHAALRRRVRREPALRRAIAALGADPRGPFDRLLLDHAFARNADGVVLASTYQPEHLATAAAAAGRSPDRELPGALAAALRDGNLREMAEPGGELRPEPR